MVSPSDPHHSLHTSAGEFPLHEYHLRLAGREWTVAHTGAVLSHAVAWWALSG